MAGIPKIRFEGFTKVWEERKLGEVTDVKTGPFGSVLHAEDYVSDGIPIITTEHFKSGRLPETKAGLPQVSDEDYSRLSGYTLETDDIVFSRVGSVDINALVTSSQNQWLFSGRVLRVRPCQGVDSMFLHTLLETDSIRNDIISRAVGQTMPSINTEILKDTLLCLPQDIEEQKAIGRYFQGLEDLIILHQRKCDETKELKKYMLQKMFSQNGERIPEIRFKGFTGDWEQRKLSSICSMHARIGWQNLRTSEFLDSGDYYLITGTDFNDGRVNLSTCHFVERDRYEQDKKIQVRNGSILITKDGTLGKVAFVEGLDRPATLNAGVFNVEILADEIDNKYLFQYLKAPFLMDYVDKKATGGTIKHLNQNILVDFPVWLPQYKEQKEIGTYFENLDDLITLHQRRCDTLKEIKKYMLQNMFSQKG